MPSHVKPCSVKMPYLWESLRFGVSCRGWVEAVFWQVSSGIIHTRRSYGNLKNVKITSRQIERSANSFVNVETLPRRLHYHFWWFLLFGRGRKIVPNARKWLYGFIHVPPKSSTRRPLGLIYTVHYLHKLNQSSWSFSRQAGSFQPEVQDSECGPGDEHNPWSKGLKLYANRFPQLCFRPDICSTRIVLNVALVHLSRWYVVLSTFTPPSFLQRHESNYLVHSWPKGDMQLLICVAIAFWRGGDRRRSQHLSRRHVPRDD